MKPPPAHHRSLAPEAQHYDDIERLVELDFVRATEAAALNALPWLGRGEKERADEAACDAIRGMFDLINICGEVVIGEGIKDEAPGIFKGEHLGTWRPGSVKFDIALDPIDGTTNIAKGAPNAISCLAAASPALGQITSMQDIPSFYMMKLAYGPRVAGYLRREGFSAVALQNPVEETIIGAARALRKRVGELVVMVLDRPRHEGLVKQVRASGASLRLIADGDITAAMGPSLPDSGIDLYIGVGGAPEAVLAAAGIKCLGGDLQAMMWPRDNEERDRLLGEGHGETMGKVFFADDLAHGKNIVFCATGISDSALLRGVRVRGNSAVTHTVLMRAQNRTLRYIETFHDFDFKSLRLRSSGRHRRLSATLGETVDAGESSDGEK